MKEVYFPRKNQSVCWQHQIRIDNRERDLQRANLTEEKVQGLRTHDFSFSFVDRTEKNKCDEVKRFVEEHDWLSSMPNRPTLRFTASKITKQAASNLLAGALVIATPSAIPDSIGTEYHDRTALIARGACISWSPKNLGSWLIMNAVRWMVKNTDYRYFLGYADPEAGERGTIYRACNFVETIPFLKLEGKRKKRFVYALGENKKETKALRSIFRTESF